MQAQAWNFSKQHRLNRSEDFRSLFQSGKKLKTSYFAIYAIANPTNYPRLGMVVAKKSVRMAVKRNLIKRVIRESFRHHQQLLIGYDVLVVTYPPISTIKKTDLKTILDKQWTKLVAFRCEK